MQNRFKAKLRRWAEADISEPFDVVVLDTETGILYCSPRTLTETEAETFDFCIGNMQESAVEFIVQGWNKDGTESDFDDIDCHFKEGI